MATIVVLHQLDKVHKSSVSQHACYSPAELRANETPSNSSCFLLNKMDSWIHEGVRTDRAINRCINLVPVFKVGSNIIFLVFSDFGVNELIYCLCF